MDKASSVLYIFSGLPGVGKSTLASALAKHFGVIYLRVDAIEQGLRDIYCVDVADEGYQLAFRIATDNLKCGLSVVVDSCNSVSESRTAWQYVATDLGIQFFNIEVICSDKAEHQRRVESRPPCIQNLTLPTWKQVQAREYLLWEKEFVRLDTAGKTIQQSIDELFLLIKAICQH